MKFVAISDTHCRHKNITLPKGDVLLHAGDVSYKGEKAEVIDFLNWFKAQPHPHKIFIAGNHDFYFERENKLALERLIPHNITYLQDSGITINGITIWGSPVTPWFFNWAFNRKRGAEINRHWRMVPDGTDILITHGPPFGMMDAVINGRNVGCKDLLQQLPRIKPKVHLFGHVHEEHGQIKKNGTLFINASVLNEHYELAYPPLVFTL